jgi:hypothetical protein
LPLHSAIPRKEGYVTAASKSENEAAGGAPRGAERNVVAGNDDWDESSYDDLKAIDDYEVEQYQIEWCRPGAASPSDNGNEGREPSEYRSDLRDGQEYAGFLKHSRSHLTMSFTSRDHTTPCATLGTQPG